MYLAMVLDNRNPSHEVSMVPLRRPWGSLASHVLYRGPGPKDTFLHARTSAVAVSVAAEASGASWAAAAANGYTIRGMRMKKDSSARGGKGEVFD